MISTILAATTQPADQMVSFPVEFILAAIAIVIAYFGFRRGPKFGPERLGAEESSGTFLLITAVGLFSIFVVDSVYFVLHPSLATTKGAVQLSPRQQIDLSLARYGIAFVVLIGANLLYRKDGIRRLGVGFLQLPLGVPVALLAALSIVPLTFLVAQYTAALWELLQRVHPQKHEMLLMLEKGPDPVLKWLVVISAGISAPIVEELLFRGHLQTLLRRVTHRPWIAIMITSLLFAVIHEWWTIPPIFFLAVGLGYIYERTNNLWVPILIHAIFNGVNLWFTLHPLTH